MKKFLFLINLYLFKKIFCIEIAFFTSSNSLNTKCYPKLGCFNLTDDFFHSRLRPVNLLPTSPEEINTQFFLFTRNNVNSPQKMQISMNLNEIKLTHFKANKPTKFLIHGFIDNQEIGVWLKVMKDNLLKYEDCNVIIVDWSGGNGLPYSQATANTRIVGAQIAALIQLLMNESLLKPELCHLIGHSLGAHIAGYTGKRIHNLGRISALDPAEPYFQNMPSSVRLDRNDAQFIDVIHSDSKSIIQLGLGMSQAVGHVDFYPNGGQQQPGCSASRFISFITEGLIHGTRQFIACNHNRAISYYIESLKLLNDKSQFRFLGYSCKSWKEFEMGKCTDCDNGKCASIGIDTIKWMIYKVNNKSIKMYMKTNNESPFLVHHYQLEIKQKKKPSGKTMFGIMFIRFYNENFNEKHFYQQKLNDNVEELVPGNNYFYLITTKHYFDSKTKFEFKWEREASLLKPNTWHLDLPFVNDEEEIYVEKIGFKEMTFNSKVKYLCANSTNPIKEKTWIKFEQTC